MLANYTDQGIRGVNDTSARAQAFRDAGKKMGIDVTDFYWTLGGYDMVTIMDAPDAETVTALGLSVGKLGNVRTQTLQAFDPPAMERVMTKVI
ncbi:MAG: GYD domain-containing protein [Pseudolabrys sp.]